MSVRAPSQPIRVGPAGIAILAVALLACALSDPRRREAVAGGPKAALLLKQTLAAVPAPSPSTTPCADSALLAARTREETPLSIDGFDDVALGAAFKGTELPLTDPWRWLNSSSLYYVPKTAGAKRMDSGDAMRLHSILQRGHVAIFRATERVDPVAAVDAFTPGKYSGSIFIMNLQTQSALCQGAVAAENSPTFPPQGPDGKPLSGEELKQAAIADLRANFDAALAAALKAMSTSVQVEIGSRVRGK